MHRSRVGKSASAARTWLGTDAKVVRHVHVCGTGYLATSTRIELVRLGIQRDTDHQLPSLHPPLVIACGDSEADESFADGAARAWDIGAPLLLASLSGRLVRIGPLIEPVVEGSIPGMAAAWPANRGTAVAGNAVADAGVGRAGPGADPRVNLYARLGAILVAAQALNFLLGARNQCVLNRVIEINPWSIESKAYKVIKVRQ